MSDNVKFSLQESKSPPLYERYALEVLESIGNPSPSQTDIGQTERFLKRIEKKTALSPRFSRYHIKVNYHGEILLLEDQSFISCAHVILLKNMGFTIDHVVHPEDLLKRKIKRYRAIIISEHFCGLNPVLIVNQLRSLLTEKTKMPKILALINKNKVEENRQMFLNHNIIEVIPYPVIFNQLSALLKNLQILPSS